MKPQFFHDVDLLELSPLHRLLFCGMWCWADREGRLADRPRQIKHDVLPMDDCDIDALLGDLIKKGFVCRYEVDGKKVLEILNFEKHQNPHPKEVPSQLPCKEISCREITRTVPEKPEPEMLSPIPSVTCHLSPHHADSGEDEVAGLPAPQENPKEEPLAFQDMLHRYVRRKGLAKPNKAVRTKAEENWLKNTLGSTDCDAAILGFWVSNWWKTADEPLLGFVKDPRSWIGRAPASDEDQDAGGFEKVVSDTGAIGDATTPVPARIDYPARWNELVPAMKVEWDWKRSPVDALRLAELDDQFVARFDEMCGIAQKKHLEFAGDLDWVTFEFAIRRSPKGLGWFRILTEVSKMKPRGVNSDIGTGPRPWVPGIVCENPEQRKERRAWQKMREAKGKHTDSDKAAREGDIS